MSAETMQALADAIAAHVADEDQEHVGAWVLIAETLTIEPTDTSSWRIDSQGSVITTRGLIEYARDTYKHSSNT